MEKNQEESNSQKKLFLKLALIFLLFLILIIPISWTANLVNERQMLQTSVLEKIDNSWGAAQIITSPVLCIPYDKAEVLEKKSVMVRHEYYLTPENVNISSVVHCEKRKSGIFDAIVYTTDMEISGNYDLTTLPQSQYNLLLTQAAMITGVSDPTRIAAAVQCQWDGQDIQTNPGIKFSGFVEHGIHQTLSVSPKKYAFKLKVKLNGSGAISHVSTGKSNQIQLQANWPSPSFFGKNLPNTKSIRADGFTAEWTNSEFNRPFPNSWIDKEQYLNHLSSEGFGVRFIETADHYQQNSRAIKYSFLIIGLSFLVFFFFEIIFKVRLHIVQYGLIGFTLALFYVLLLSISEQVGFHLAYWISYLAIFTLILFYTKSILRLWKPVLILLSLLTFVNGYIFAILQLEDYALLVGAVGLFLLMFAVMYVTRRIEWYKV